MKASTQRALWFSLALVIWPARRIVMVPVCICTGLCDGWKDWLWDSKTHWRNMMLNIDSWTDTKERCEGCGNEIDATTCHCGTAEQDHTYTEHSHSFVPMGCDCGRA